MNPVDVQEAVKRILQWDVDRIAALVTGLLFGGAACFWWTRHLHAQNAALAVQNQHLHAQVAGLTMHNQQLQAQNAILATENQSLQQQVAAAGLSQYEIDWVTLESDLEAIVHDLQNNVTQ